MSMLSKDTLRLLRLVEVFTEKDLNAISKALILLAKLIFSSLSVVHLFFKVIREDLNAIIQTIVFFLKISCTALLSLSGNIDLNVIQLLLQRLTKLVQSIQEFLLDVLSKTLLSN
eukprot:TRINITY_DN1536_c0_g2_i5.p1 TRINITY_DN1536_c0_g2~~TRINITY_DN1536_c0_g2_i5.p1  ORF type:complete len:115 (-),score=21.81 TRINITY_DN1536_c0_g2_i5:94-438(-)